MPTIKRVLVPVDGSKTSHNAISYAAKLSRGEVTMLCLLTVLDRGLYKEDTPHSSEHRAKIILDEAMIIAENLGIKDAQTELAYGPVPETIVRVASEKMIDIIVMGTHGRTGAQIPKMGHVSEKVVEKATCPVLLVR